MPMSDKTLLRILADTGLIEVLPHGKGNEADMLNRLVEDMNLNPDDNLELSEEEINVIFRS